MVADKTIARLKGVRHGTRNSRQQCYNDLTGNKLVIEVDLSQEFGISSSGKSRTVASTKGNVAIPEHPDIKIGLNIYKSAR